MTAAPPVPPPRRRRLWVRASAAERLYAALLLAAVAGAVPWLAAHDPAATRAAPRCLTYAWTGVLCPGCGAMRAAHALLSGDLTAALALNPLFVLAAPLGAVWLILLAVCAAGGLRPRVAPRALALAGLGAVVLLLGFTVARNTPLRCCDPLRPPPDRMEAP